MALINPGTNLTPDQRAAQNAPSSAKVPERTYQSSRKGVFDKQKYKVSNFTYPSDLLGANNEYGSSYVVFYINVQEGSKLRSAGIDGTGATIPEGVDASSSGKRAEIIDNKTYTPLEVGASGVVSGAIVGPVSGAIGSRSGEFASSTLKGAKKGAIAGGIAGAVDAFVLSTAASANKPTKRLETAIALYMPNELSVNYRSNWSDQDTAVAQMSMKLPGDVVDAIMSQNFDKVKGVASGALGNLALSQGLHKHALSAITRQAANSKKEMLFTNVDFRTFTFNYKFAPRSIEELTIVENIIQMFKFHMHPEFVEGSGNYLYVYPSEFDIMYYINGNENPHLHRHTSCALTEMQVNKAPNGNFAAFTNGAPTEITIQLTFRELALLSKEEIAQGY